MRPKMKRVLVTGATGFIGRHLCKALAARGVQVMALVRSKNSNLPPGMQPVTGDICDRASLTTLPEHDVCFHLAAAVSFNRKDLKKIEQVNVQGTANILDATGNTRIVVTSSACTLGLSQSASKILDENARPTAKVIERNPYLASKLAVESMCERAAGQGRKTIVVCPTTVYGPGDYSLNSGTLILKVASGAVIPIPPGGSNVVDVVDVTEGLIAAAELGIAGKRYVLGGYNFRFAEIIRNICEATGATPMQVPFPAFTRILASLAMRLAGPILGGRLFTPQLIDDLYAYKYYSSELASEELGWKARTPFVDTLRHAWEFYRQEGLA